MSPGKRVSNSRTGRTQRRPVTGSVSRVNPAVQMPLSILVMARMRTSWGGTVFSLCRKPNSPSERFDMGMFQMSWETWRTAVNRRCWVTLHIEGPIQHRLFRPVRSHIPI